MIPCAARKLHHIINVATISCVAESDACCSELDTQFIEASNVPGRSSKDLTSSRKWSSEWHQSPRGYSLTFKTGEGSMPLDPKY